MIELEEALQRVLAAVPARQTERIPVVEALDRILAESVTALVNLPPFDNSAMDGYAVRAADVSHASGEKPACLRLVGKVVAGETFAGTLGEGECVRLFTGSPLPMGADAVVMQEDTRTDGPGKVLVLDPAKPWENIRLRGGDIRQGTLIAQAGEVLTPARIGLLSACGLAEIGVGKRPVVGLLVTGSELREAGQPLKAGEIYESNRSLLAALATRAGAIPRVLPLVIDTEAATINALEAALATCDAVVTAGGASVGEMDFVKAAVGRLGGKIDFWQIAMRPGKPFFLGNCRGKPVFGLPGNPVSAFVTFLLLVRPALRSWQGATETKLPSHPGVLAEPLANPGDRRHFMRVMVDVQGRIHPSGLQSSHALSSLAAANGLLELKPQAQWAAGDTLEVMRLDAV